MLWRLLLLMTVVPAIELYLLMQLADMMGIVETIALILVTGAVGSFLAKREGLGVLQQLQKDMQKGIPPADRLIEGVLVLIGGTLLITPGVLTDLAGFCLIFPKTRQFLAPRLKTWLASKFKISMMGGTGATQGAPEPDFVRPSRPAPPAFEHPER